MIGRVPLNESGNLTADEHQRWAKMLRQLRIEARDKIQECLDASSSTSNWAEDQWGDLRRAICEMIVTFLAVLLPSYWRDRGIAESDLCFFFSPGYRPYGLGRVALEEMIPTTPRAERQRALQLALGRWWPPTTPLHFALAPWMHHVYEQKIASGAATVKVGGFTDWFSQFRRVSVAYEERAEPLVALVISTLTAGSGLHNGTARVPVSANSDPARCLSDFENSLRATYAHIRFIWGDETGRSVTPRSIAPYPPAYVLRDDEWVPVDLAALSTTEGLTPNERHELELARERFACLFRSIFAPLAELPPALASDDTSLKAFREYMPAELMSFPHYYVMITDQALTDRFRTQLKEAPLGTLNLYTTQPLSDIAIGLLRDCFEAIYDSVRTAERLARMNTLAIHADAAIARLLDCWVRPWFQQPQLQHWNHDLVNELQSDDPLWEVYLKAFADAFPTVSRISSFAADGSPKSPGVALSNLKTVMKALFSLPSVGDLETSNNKPLEALTVRAILRDLDLEAVTTLSQNKLLTPGRPGFTFFCGLRVIWNARSNDKDPPFFELSERSCRIRFRGSDFEKDAVLKTAAGRTDGMVGALKALHSGQIRGLDTSHMELWRRKPLSQLQYDKSSTRGFIMDGDTVEVSW